MNINYIAGGVIALIIAVILTFAFFTMRDLESAHDRAERLQRGTGSLTAVFAVFAWIIGGALIAAGIWLD